MQKLSRRGELLVQVGTVSLVLKVPINNRYSLIDNLQLTIQVFVWLDIY